jgi:hypothetical protein
MTWSMSWPSRRAAIGGGRTATCSCSTDSFLDCRCGSGCARRSPPLRRAQPATTFDGANAGACWPCSSAPARRLHPTQERVTPPMRRSAERSRRPWYGRRWTKRAPSGAIRREGCGATLRNRPLRNPLLIPTFCPVDLLPGSAMCVFVCRG